MHKGTDLSPYAYFINVTEFRKVKCSEDVSFWK
jgi:hypothetical protein